MHDKNVFTDDEPDDGAQHYIVIYGFHSPHLFTVLAGLDINIQSIISLGSQDYSFFHSKDDDAVDEKAKGLLILLPGIPFDWNKILNLQCLTSTGRHKNLCTTIIVTGTGTGRHKPVHNYS